MLAALLMVVMALLAVFLILLVLVQRGRGGGLAGALGGMGGQSAFGTKAGDLFTRITIVVATIWILVCILSVKYLSTMDNPLAEGNYGSSAPATPGGAHTGTGATGSAPTGETPASSDETGLPPADGSGTAPESTPPANNQ
jgi:preprotein translocase subunit SecG